MQFKIHNEGWSYFVITLIISIIVIPFYNIFGFLLFILAIFIYYFFRDPIRTVPVEDVIISPADGKVTYIGIEHAPKNLNIDQKFIKISIFLSVFNVHVNRMPISGTIEKIKYLHGKFINASLNKSSESNERNIILIKKENSDYFILTQIAGLIARRIVCIVKENQSLNKGDRVGIIKFGSRVDLYMPLNYKPLITIGQTVIGGETIIANPNSINEIKQSIKK